MKNLAGVKEADKDIITELYMANIPMFTEKSKGEVPYTKIGKVGYWTFHRAWYYWIASCKEKGKGLPLKEAIELHEKEHPTKGNMGQTIRSGGHCGCPSPVEYGAQPVFNEKLDKQLYGLGYKKTYSKALDEEYWSITYGEISKLCEEGKLEVDQYVNCYHIDDQIGLNEFVKAITN